jgi:2-keto-4-pentenoate hydratase/2-oxohepta-3-ene-1,7-dioic acid hydratase in catechol pathway
MRLVTYNADGTQRAGILRGDRVVDATHAAAEVGPAGDAVVLSVRNLLEASPSWLARLDEAARAGDGIAIEDVELGPPIPDPEKVLCIGLNYREHAAEGDLELPTAPIVFAKFRTALVGNRGLIRLPRSNPDHVDFEGELAVVIGRRAERIREADALGHVAGYMPFNDVSARDLQLSSPQWTMGKAFDTSGPCGPALVTSDEVPDPQALRLQTIHNGEVVQAASTSEMIFSVAQLVAYISSLITLVPGDVIATGTPAGIGHVRQPPRYLNEGDTIEVEIERLGRLTNTVVNGHA